MSELNGDGLLAALMDAAVDAIIVMNAGGTILQANNAAAGLFGYEASELVAQDVGILMPEAMGRRHGGFVEHHLETGHRAIIGKGRDVEGRRADGSVFPLALSVGRAETDAGPLFISILHDLSTRRAMEEAAERSQKMDAIGRMTGGIAHDFNNLLTVVIGNLQLLEAAELTDRHRAMLSDALQAAEVGADLTSRLTVFARNSDLKPKRVDLAEEVERSLGLLRHTIGSHCEILTKSAPDLWPVSIDATKLQTAILNLAMNAQDAMAEGGVLSIDVQNTDIDDTYIAQELDVQHGRYVRVSVGDTGHGMSPEDRERALEPFFTTKALGHGTGLGLPMVYGFVKQSGGHLAIYSEPGEGTVVSLYFPAAEGGELAAFSTATQSVKLPNAAKGSTILIVEDDERLRRLSEARLSAMGFTCLMATTADEAWDVLRKDHDIALVFADMVMPGTMTGYDLAQRLAETQPNVRVLLTSGFSESVLHNRQIGMEFAMLRKPYRQADLERQIYALLADD